MITHGSIWRAIDLLTAQQGLSVAQLARQAGLDRTTFAKSKRRRNGRSRWPSTESLSRILQATNSDMSDFTSLMHSDNDHLTVPRLPVIGLAQAGRAGFFDDVGDPGDAWYPVSAG